MNRVSSVRLFVWAAAFCTILPTAGASRTDSDPDLLLEVDGLDVAVWRPNGGSSPYPLVLFSHGIGGCMTQSTYLMRALAEHGMLVVAPDHQDRGRNCPNGLPTLQEVVEKFPGLHQDRRDDLKKLRMALPDDPDLASWPIDPDRVALIGHSLGGYTVLGLAGAWPDWQMNDIAAVVALAPYVLPFQNDGAVETISVPVLLQSGSEDVFTPSKDHDAIFAKLNAPACQVVYAGADHFAWTDLDTAGFHDATTAAAIAFLDEVFAKRPLDKAILASSRTDHRETCN